jgi:hypothetical protein
LDQCRFIIACLQHGLGQPALHHAIPTDDYKIGYLVIVQPGYFSAFQTIDYLGGRVVPCIVS